MKRYSLPYLTQEQRQALESTLLEEVELQTWYTVVVFARSQTEILVCLQ